MEQLSKSADNQKSAGANDAGPDYDDLPRGDFNPMWEVAIGMGILLVALAAVVALG